MKVMLIVLIAALSGLAVATEAETGREVQGAPWFCHGELLTVPPNLSDL